MRSKARLTITLSHDLLERLDRAITHQGLRNRSQAIDTLLQRALRPTVREAVIMSGQIRMRPIWVTDLTMMAGAFAILFDPIFQGMAISLLFGPVVATSLTLIVVPLGCISAGAAFHPEETVVVQKKTQRIAG